MIRIRPLAMLNTSIKTLTALSLSLMVACSSQPARQTAPALDLSKLQKWNIEGKLGVRTSDNAHSAYIHWQHDTPNYQIQVFGPFGKGKINIEKHGERVTLSDNDKTLEAHSAEELLYKASGLKMPLSGLGWWIKGLTVPYKAGDNAHATHKASNLTYDNDGRLEQFDQLGWHVSYKRFTKIGNTELPAKLILKSEEYQLTLIIKKWDLGN